VWMNIEVGLDEGDAISTWRSDHLESFFSLHHELA